MSINFKLNVKSCSLPNSNPIQQHKLANNNYLRDQETLISYFEEEKFDRFDQQSASLACYSELHIDKTSPEWAYRTCYCLLICEFNRVCEQGFNCQTEGGSVDWNKEEELLLTVVNRMQELAQQLAQRSNSAGKREMLLDMLSKLWAQESSLKQQISVINSGNGILDRVLVETVKNMLNLDNRCLDSVQNILQALSNLIQHNEAQSPESVNSSPRCRRNSLFRMSKYLEIEDQDHQKCVLCKKQRCVKIRVNRNANQKQILISDLHLSDTNSPRRLIPRHFKKLSDLMANASLAESLGRVTQSPPCSPGREYDMEQLGPQRKTSVDVQQRSQTFEQSSDPLLLANLGPLDLKGEVQKKQQILRKKSTRRQGSKPCFHPRSVVSQLSSESKFSYVVQKVLFARNGQQQQQQQQQNEVYEQEQNRRKSKTDLEQDIGSSQFIARSTKSEKDQEPEYDGEVDDDRLKSCNYAEKFRTDKNIGNKLFQLAALQPRVVGPSKSRFSSINNSFTNLFNNQTDRIDDEVMTPSNSLDPEPQPPSQKLNSFQETRLQSKIHTMISEQSQIKPNLATQQRCKTLQEMNDENQPLMSQLYDGLTNQSILKILSPGIAENLSQQKMEATFTTFEKLTSEKKGIKSCAHQRVSRRLFKLVTQYAMRPAGTSTTHLEAQEIKNRSSHTLGSVEGPVMPLTSLLNTRIIQKKYQSLASSRDIKKQISKQGMNNSTINIFQGKMKNQKPFQPGNLRQISSLCNTPISNRTQINFTYTSPHNSTFLAADLKRQPSFTQVHTRVCLAQTNSKHTEYMMPPQLMLKTAPPALLSKNKTLGFVNEPTLGVLSTPLKCQPQQTIYQNIANKDQLENFRRTSIDRNPFTKLQKLFK